MKYYVLEPEVAGEIGENSKVDFNSTPPVVNELEYVFHGWLGDDILESYPCFIVTERVENAINECGFSGVKFTKITITRSEMFDELYPDKILPNFVRLIPFGKDGSDDFGISAEQNLVVSERVLSILKRYRIEHCEINDFEIS